MALFLDAHGLLELHALGDIIFMYISAQGFIDLDLDEVSLFLHFQVLSVLGKCGEDRAVGTRLLAES